MLCRLPQQKLDLEALLFVDSLRERLPRNFNLSARTAQTLWGFDLLPSVDFRFPLLLSAEVSGFAPLVSPTLALLPCENSLVAINWKFIL